VAQVKSRAEHRVARAGGESSGTHPAGGRNDLVPGLAALAQPPAIKSLTPLDMPGRCIDSIQDAYAT
jgi:hypothetical protein